MFHVFVQYNHKIAEFQVVLTFLATAIEVLLAVFLAAGIIAFATEEDGSEIMQQPLKLSNTDAADSPSVDEQIRLLPKEPVTLQELKIALKSVGTSGVSRMNKSQLKELWNIYVNSSSSSNEQYA